MIDKDRFVKAAKTLEFSKILQMLAECATTEGAKEEALAASPYSDKKKMTDLLTETEDCRRLYISKGEPSFGQIKNVLPLIERADKGAVLSAAEILECEPVPKSKKLLKLKLDLGYEQRQVLSGIAQYYTPDKLIGKKVVVVANLKPRMMMGYESKGMVLASSAEGDTVRVIFLDPETPNGQRIS